MENLEWEIWRQHLATTVELPMSDIQILEVALICIINLLDYIKVNFNETTDLLVISF